MRHREYRGKWRVAGNVVLAVGAFLLFAMSPGLPVQDEHAGQPLALPGLQAAAQIIRDSTGIAHIRATNDHDLFFLQGYVHAQDRFFQMDFYRHAGSGTLAELVGNAGLAQDVQTRTLGLRRAGERSLAASSARARRVLEAYAEGVNAWTVAHLPPEYAALGITEVDPWQPLDSLTVAKLLAWQQIFTDFDLPYTIALMSYRQAGAMMGFDGTKLFFEDLVRSAPFETASTIPDALGQRVAASPKFHHGQGPNYDPETMELVKRHVLETEGLDLFRNRREGGSGGGSNTWVVGGSLTMDGSPLLANDPHVDFLYPPLFYPIHLTAGVIDVTGQSFPGSPLVFAGHNDWMSWGSTATGVDILDYYSEQVVPDSTSPSGLSTVYRGTLEPIIPVPQVFRTRVGGQLEVVPAGGAIPAFTLIVPRRNNGPIVQFTAATGAAVSMQWAEFSGSHEVEAMLVWAEARTVEDFEQGVRLFTFPQNFTYIDRSGNFGYYMSGELPIREDLQQGTVVGLPPWFLRNGQGGNEWAPVTNPQPGQALPCEIIPFEDMPHILNPPSGWVVNGNDDPAGVTLGNNPLAEMRPGIGIYYLGYVFSPGQRAARITELIKEKTRGGSITFQDMQKIQADTVLMDARFFVPHIAQAFDNVMRGTNAALASLALDPGVTEAVLRLRVWDFKTPTGIPQGNDAFMAPGHSPSPAEVASSVCATIYAMWRSRFVARVIDEKLTALGLPLPDPNRCTTALRHLLESFPLRQGVGESGFSFFDLPGVASPSERRDIYILRALRDALTLLAGDGFKNAYGNSTNQNDYRWGKLSRLVMPHLLGAPFSVPPAGGRFLPPLANLSGIPVDGGLATVDPAAATVRATDENSFVFRLGPLERSVAVALPSGIRGVSSLGGGISGVITSPLYCNLLKGWLTNTGYYDQYFGPDELQGNISSVLKLVPAEGANR